MKNALLFVSGLCVVTVMIVGSCKSSNYNDISTNENGPLTGLRPTPQNLAVQAGRDTVIMGAKGTVFHFYTNSFKDANGKIITSGTVNMQLQEMYNAGDMIQNGATTMSNGNILQSAGQIDITATMNGQQVFANGYGIGFKHSAGSNQPMSLFYGSTDNAQSAATWTQSDTTQKGSMTSGTTKVNYPGSPGGVPDNYYFFDTCKSFHWANCDWFYSNDSPKTTVSIVLPDTSFNPRNTQLYLVLPDISRGRDTVKAVLATSEFSLGSSSYVAATNTMQLVSEGEKSVVPAGTKYELVVIAHKNSGYYFYERSGIVPHSGILDTVSMVTDTQGDMIARLQGL